jgi:hypothetical protein
MWKQSVHFHPAFDPIKRCENLCLLDCNIGDNVIRLLADALVGNTTMEKLDISDDNDTSSVGLDAISRLLESTRLKTILFYWGDEFCDDFDATQRFVSTLLHKNSTLLELPLLERHGFPGAFDDDDGIAAFASIRICLTRNRQLNRANNLLLAPLLTPTPTTPLVRRQQHAMTMTKTWHKAITKFAMVRNNAGASAIFKLFTARPQLLEKRIKRPAVESAEPAISRQQQQQQQQQQQDATW